jgi:hypothetical protein
MSEWQNLESAPKDETTVLLAVSGGAIVMARYVPKGLNQGWRAGVKLHIAGSPFSGNAVIEILYELPVTDPKFWMPLPQPPEKKP